MDEQPKETSKIYFYISIALCAASAIAFGLIFTPLALYSLLASIILSIAALSMAVTQKKKNNFRAVKYLIVIIYCVLAAETAFFIGGLIYSALV